jgi:hypothetical protein
MFAFATREMPPSGNNDATSRPKKMQFCVERPLESIWKNFFSNVAGVSEPRQDQEFRKT